MTNSYSCVRIEKICMLAGLCLILLGCMKHVINSGDDSNPVASFIPSEVSVEQIEGLLREHHIDSRIGGSRAYQITVPAKLTSKAKAVLKQSKFKPNLIIY